MTPDIVIRVTGDDAAWPAPIPVPADLVLAGSPAVSTVVRSEEGGVQLGMWRVSPGSFATDHEGYSEFIHVIDGQGRLVSESGRTTELYRGVTTLLPMGWRDRWEVDTPLTKIFTIVPV